MQPLLLVCTYIIIYTFFLQRRYAQHIVLTSEVFVVNKNHYSIIKN